MAGANYPVGTPEAVLDDREEVAQPGSTPRSFRESGRSQPDPSLGLQWFARHRKLFQQADAACRDRSAFTPFIESPRAALHPANAKRSGQQWFENQLNGSLLDTAPDGAGRATGHESSPFTGEPLGIRYSRPTPAQIFAATAKAMPPWAAADYRCRLGVCLEALDRLHADLFANAYATMHTTGQPFMMAFAGSGANSLDRGLEALVYAGRAMADVAPAATFERSFGKEQVRLTKRYQLRPRGVGVVIACGSYPAWNMYPALFASLATGNPVVVKPHPTTVLPVARAVQILREVLREAGYDPNLVILAVDTPTEPIAGELVDHPDAAIVDFTGGPDYGQVLERRWDRLVFTETAGTNAVILESAEDLRSVLQALARSVCLFSGQMCTTPQNVFVPPTIRTPEGDVTYDEVARQFLAAIEEVLADPDRAAGVCGAVHNPATIAALDDLAATSQGNQESTPQAGAASHSDSTILRAHLPYAHPDFPKARTCTPLVIQETREGTAHRAERFGPVVFLIPVADRAAAVASAAQDAMDCGAIASYCYTTDPEFAQEVERAFFAAGASIAFNLQRQAPINFTAAYSDYHVTGLNPAGNACLTDLAFVANRFRIVQSKTEQ